MQDGQVDYSTFSRSELTEALASINRDKFPRNYENLRKALEGAPAEGARVVVQIAEPFRPSDPLSSVPKSAYVALRHHLSDAVAAILVPSLVILATCWVQPAASAAYAVAFTVQFGCWVVLAVRLHRLILVSPAASETATTHQYGWYLAWSVATLGLLAIWLVPFVFLKKAGGLLVLWFLASLPAVVYTGIRLSLVLPDRAIGQSTAFSTVWSWSAGRGWSLVFFVGAPVAAINALVGFSAKFLPSPWGYVFQMLLLIPVTAFQIASLSCAYRLLAMHANGDDMETGHGA